MSSRLKSALATALVQGGLAYALIMGLAMTVTREAPDKLATVELTAERTAGPPPPPAAKAPLSLPRTVPVQEGATLAADRPVILGDWATATVEQRNSDFVKAHKWVQDNMPEEERRFGRWRAAVPQGSGPARVTRVTPRSLSTHTVYWPARWRGGPLPIIAWGNGYSGICSNTSLPYAAFLSEIASHGYFVVAVGNDDIEYPQPDGLAVLADGRPLRTQASSLRKAVDWAVAENVRAGGPHAGTLDTGKIVYMGHGCGGRQALEAAADPRSTTTVLLNSDASFQAHSAGSAAPPLARFDGSTADRGIREAAAANFERADSAGWRMFTATFEGEGEDDVYAGPDRRWTRAVLGWLAWQLKGDAAAANRLQQMPNTKSSNFGLASPTASTP